MCTNHGNHVKVLAVFEFLLPALKLLLSVFVHFGVRRAVGNVLRVLEVPHELSKVQPPHIRAVTPSDMALGGFGSIHPHPPPCCPHLGSHYQKVGSSEVRRKPKPPHKPPTVVHGFKVFLNGKKEGSIIQKRY